MSNFIIIHHACYTSKPNYDSMMKIIIIIINIIDDSQSVTSLRDQQPGLDSDSSGADNLTVSGHISQLEFDSATNRRIPSPEAIQAK